MSLINSKQFNQPVNITGSLYGTASYAIFAANGGGGGATFPYSGNAQITGSLSISGSATATSFTGSLQGSASYALTASYAINGGGTGNGFPYSGDAIITGSLLVSGSGNFTNGLNVNGTLTNNGTQINTAGLALANYYNFI